MKKIFIAVMLLTFASCEKNVESINTSVSLGYTTDLQVIKIYGCQYLFGDWGNATVLTHKGNCNNPIHALNYNKMEFITSYYQKGKFRKF